MRIGVFATSRLENERRIPIHPEHLSRIPPSLRASLVFEHDYAKGFGYPVSCLTELGCAGIEPRQKLFETCDVLILPKPVLADLQSMRSGQVLFGWCHCVQQHAIAQAAIDRRLTLMTWESMFHWDPSGVRQVHLFYKNNEIAGYAAVLHCLQLLGIDGYYGPRRKVVILSYGSVSRGAIYALQGRGFNNIHVFSRRPPHLIGDQNPDVYFGQYYSHRNGSWWVRTSEGCEHPLIEELAEADIICNGILQDTDKPILYLAPNEVCRLKPRCVIIDISCDRGMGFPFAQPTSFEAPVLNIEPDITYYSVDHTPSYLWNAASREISRALLPYLPAVQAGPDAWQRDPTLRQAIEIQDGLVLNPKILSFQHRSPRFPHLPLNSETA